MHYEFQTKGVCARVIECDIENKVLKNIKFHGGCPGNLQMLSKIFEGWKVCDVIKMCKGNICGMRKTSCADQLAISLEKVLDSIKQEA